MKMTHTVFKEFTFDSAHRNNSDSVAPWDPPSPSSIDQRIMAHASRIASRMGRGRGRKFKKRKGFFCKCRCCGAKFFSADVKGCFCPECKGPRPCDCGCGTIITSKRGAKYAPGHHPATQSQAAHAKQAEAIRGDNNPAKRSRDAISRGVKANHWFKLYPLLAFAHVIKMHQSERKKVSRLDQAIATIAPHLHPQYKVGFYRIDLANPTRKTAVEVQGCWYHACQKCFPVGVTSETQRANVANDKRKNSYLTNRGWTMVYIWEHEFRENPEGVRNVLHGL